MFGIEYVLTKLAPIYEDVVIQSSHLIMYPKTKKIIPHIVEPDSFAHIYRGFTQINSLLQLDLLARYPRMCFKKRKDFPKYKYKHVSGSNNQYI